jgi:hypothetical protein
LRNQGILISIQPVPFIHESFVRPHAIGMHERPAVLSSVIFFSFDRESSSLMENFEALCTLSQNECVFGSLTQVFAEIGAEEEKEINYQCLHPFVITFKVRPDVLLDNFLPVHANKAFCIAPAGNFLCQSRGECVSSCCSLLP